MTIDDVRKLAACLNSLAHWKEELERYKTENYLHLEHQVPTITITIGNHPTCIADLIVPVRKNVNRQALHQMVVDEMKHKINSLTQEAARLQKGAK
jgi:hypothetical protein